MRMRLSVLGFALFHKTNLIYKYMKLNLLTPNAYYDMVAGMPSFLQKDNDGSHLYRYNIQPQMVVDEEGGQEKQVGWQCREIRIWEQPTKSALKKAIIRSLIDEAKELNIINSYNKHVLGVKVCEQAVEEYKEFLLFTEELDEMLGNDFKE